MGCGRYNPSDFSKFAIHTDGKSEKEIFTRHAIKDELNPLNFKMRESCDSEYNPNSTPIIVAVDVTGSMGMLATNIIKSGLKVLATEIYNDKRKTVSDPHLMFMAVGDVEWDKAPLQVTQFEADIRIAEQLKDFYIEHGGGGNSYESYTLPWYYAATHTKIDSMIKRHKKGILFTVGDERCTPNISKEAIKKFIGDDIQPDKFTAEELLTMVSQKYEVYHIIIAEGSHMRYDADGVIGSWDKILKDHAIILQDYTKLAELIVSILQVSNGGEDNDKVADSWDSSTSLVIRDAIKNLKKTNENNGLVEL